jgi:hypothetical protein
MKDRLTPTAVAALIAAVTFFAPTASHAQQSENQAASGVAAKSMTSSEKKEAPMAEKKEASEEGGERAVTLESVPASVRQAIEKEIGEKGKLVKLVEESEEGKTAYEADFIKDGVECSVKVAPSGAVVEVEKKVSEEGLPEVVKQALRKAVGKGKVKESLAVTSYFYEFEVEEDGEMKEVKIDPLGKVDAEEEKSEEKAEGKEEKEEVEEHAKAPSKKGEASQEHGEKNEEGERSERK